MWKEGLCYLSFERLQMKGRESLSVMDFFHSNPFPHGKKP